MASPAQRLLGSMRSTPQSAILDCPPLAERLPGDPSWGHSTPRQVTDRLFPRFSLYLGPFPSDQSRCGGGRADPH